MVAGYAAAVRGSMQERWMERTWMARTWGARAWVVIAAAVVCVAVAARPAEAHWNNFNSVRPRCGQKGSTVEVKISGNYIADPQEFIFYRPGIKAVDISYEGKFEHGTVKCTFEIAADCPPGEHVFRIRTKTQLTNAATFHVSPFPVIDEVEGDKERKTPDNDSLASAMPVPSNVTVRGTISGKPKDDVDIFRVPVTASGRLSVEVDAIRISDIPHTHGVEPNSSDLAVRVLDANGRELAINDDNPLHTQDPLVSLKLPADYPSSGADGTVAYVEVRRTIFGSWPAPYSVHIGSFSRPLAAYPAGGPAGKPLQVKLIGDPLGDVDQTIAVPEATGTFEYYGDAPSPLLLRSSSLPNTLEDAAAAETRVAALPAALNGIVDKPGDVDLWRVSVKKGERYRVRVYAAALGLPLQPKIRIMPVDADGKPGKEEVKAHESTRDDRELFGISAYGGSVVRDSLDPSVIWEPKADGDYVLEFADLSGAGKPSAVYRIEVETPPDAVYTVLPTTLYWWEAPKWASLAIPQGDRWTVNVNLPQGQGSKFKGELEIVAHGLPAGVKLLPNRVPAGESPWPIQFVADATAAPAVSLITLEARPVDPAQKIVSGSRMNLPFLNSPGGDAWRTVRLDRFVLAVVDPSPFSVEIEEPKVPIVRGGSLGVPVKITRRNGYDEPIGLQFDYGPKGIGRPPQVIVPSGESSAVLELTAEAGAALGTKLLVLTALTKSQGDQAWCGHGQIRVSTAIVNLTVAEPFVELAAEPESVRRGEKKKFVWTLRHKSPFEGEASVKLLGIPKGVTVSEPLPVITKDSKEVAFQVEANDDALLGAVSGLSCEVVVKAGGQEIHQRSGKGVLRIDPRL
jgi:hypothetical protein